MKKLFLLPVLAIGLLAGCATVDSVDASDILNPQELLPTGIENDLGSTEAESMIHMRQEEMLARDVYNELYKKWNLKIFDNIAKSEQTHMDTVLVLLQTYGYQDPINPDQPGQYASAELQNIYDQLIAQGSSSLTDALEVGAIIEDLDINDLNKYLQSVDNEDIRVAYQNLQKGSRNHLRAFARQLGRDGIMYEAHFISETELNDILGTPAERYLVDANGNP